MPTLLILSLIEPILDSEGEQYLQKSSRKEWSLRLGGKSMRVKIINIQ